MYAVSVFLVDTERTDGQMDACVGTRCLDLAASIDIEPWPRACCVLRYAVADIACVKQSLTSLNLCDHYCVIFPSDNTQEEGTSC